MIYKTLQHIQDARELISPPGDSLRETIEARGIPQKELALRMGRPLKTINEIIQAKTAITPETALQLERVLSIPADFWLERERRYRLKLAEITEAEKMLKNTEKDKEWIKKFPLSSMKKLGWLTYEKDPLSKIESLCSFFGVSGQDGYYAYYHKEVYATAYRMSKSSGKSSYAVAAWLRQGEQQAAAMKEAGKYHAQTFKEALKDIKLMMAAPPENFFQKLQYICEQAGVKVVHTPCLPGTRLHGSTRWIKGNPLIQLSNLYKRNDIFWFTFFHEAGHILKHGKTQMFVEGLEEYDQKQSVMEKEADEFARKYTFTTLEEKIVRSNLTLTKEKIDDFARQFNTHPAMIIGRLARDNKRLNQIGWTMHFFQKIDLTRAE